MNKGIIQQAFPFIRTIPRMVKQPCHRCGCLKQKVLGERYSETEAYEGYVLDIECARCGFPDVKYFTDDAEVEKEDVHH